ncbi:MAG: homocysteine S-methyltransferase [Ilumatobacter sp.]|nr:homocysteine S-methyltransferase [Ilumatobacter sp.]
MAGLTQLHAPLTLTDGGLETTLIFHDGFDLPYFAAFVLLDSNGGNAALDHYVDSYVDVARRHRLPLVVETATWRASPDWARLLDVSDEQLATLNRRSVEAVASRASGVELVVSGCVGPRGDGYVADTAMTAADAQAYHGLQIEALRDGGAELVSAITMTNSAEAIGIARAAHDADIACVISFTVETDGRLPSGEALGDAVTAVDAATGSTPAYYMVNCAHPTHFVDALEPSDWMNRIKGVRANASALTHAELDAAEELDAGDPVDLAEQYAGLRATHPGITIFGGCCGTDPRHVDAAATTLTR